MSRSDLNNSNVNVGMGVRNDQMPPDGNMMSSSRRQQMDNYGTTPGGYFPYQAFLCGICCEAFLYLIGPIFYALYLFEGLGKKNEPGYDCFANWHDDYAMPGVMDIDDPEWVNVSYLFRVLLITELTVSLFALLVMIPLRICFGIQYYNDQNRMTPSGWQETLTNRPQQIANCTGSLFFLVAIFAIVVRLIHPGRVCSGDFLPDLEKDNDVIRTYYDIEVGFFLFIIMILSFISVGFTALCWCVCCTALCCLFCGFTAAYQGRTPNDFNQNMTADQMNQYMNHQQVQMTDVSNMGNVSPKVKDRSFN